MKSCPGCSFLMGDEDSLCSTCASGTAPRFPIDDVPFASATGSSFDNPSTAPGGHPAVEPPPFRGSAVAGRTSYGEASPPSYGAQSFGAQSFDGPDDGGPRFGEPSPSDSRSAVAVAAPPGSTLMGSVSLLERPVAGPPRQELQLRDPGWSRRTVRACLVLLVLLVGTGVLGAMAMSGEGPLAPAAVSLGLADPPLVQVPRTWVTTTSAEGKLSVELPLGAVEAEALFDQRDPNRGKLTGHSVTLGPRGKMLVLSTDAIGGAPVGSPDDAQLQLLVDAFLADERYGAETVRREALLGSGHAVDSVVVSHDERSTTRIRFLADGGRLHLLITTGSDEGARDLDEAHARLIDSVVIDR